MPRPKSPDPKTDALRSVGALNPHPAAVKDEIFAGSDFFDRRDLVQVRYEMVRRVRTDGRPLAETATRFGVSRPTYYKLSAEFEREGICGLCPRSAVPRVATNYVQRSSRRCGRRARRTPPWMPPRSWNS